MNYKVVFKDKEAFFTGNAVTFYTFQEAVQWGAKIVASWGHRISDYAVLSAKVEPDNGVWYSPTLIEEERIYAKL